MTEDQLGPVEPWIAALVSELPGAEVIAYPEWGSQTLQVAGKHFGRVGSDPQGQRILTLKGDPDDNAALVQEYEAVTPGYYANKRLWISVRIEDGSVPRELVEEALKSAYAIVRASLPKRVQAQLG
ncbi:MmcQ/YjbR family DNA-binding protein [Demequina aurantiaca]|uniref:MmcQ/YjbR family DNA-binding protein n=1 Tax=Demequina aurantiaca TaxID=676200 RepID=UPI003D32BAEB